MYSVLSNIVIQQIPTADLPNRRKVIEFSFLNAYEASSTWAELTQTLKITLPKKVKIRYTEWTTEPDVDFPVYHTDFIDFSQPVGDNVHIGGSINPTFLRGDLITFNVGYRTIINGVETTYMTGSTFDGVAVPPLFKGFISKVNPKLPFTLECEDNMWLLKQMATPAQSWGKKSLQEIVRTIIALPQNLPIVQKYSNYVKLSVSTLVETGIVFNVNNFITIRGSLGQLLARIKNEYHYDSYFRGDELRMGYLHYKEGEALEHDFTFQKNIISDNLCWERKDDTILSVVVSSHYLITDGTTTEDGAPKTKQGRTEVMVYSDIKGNFVMAKKEKGKDYETKSLKEMGQRFTLNIQDAVTDPNKLFTIGKTLLKKYYYDGFKGSFTTFGIPYVKHGDTVNIINPSLPEQDGRYKVKGVRYYGGFTDGLRQEISLDYKI